MNRLIFRGGNNYPFELFIYDTENPSGSFTISLTPQQVLHLIVIASNGYASWAEAKEFADRTVDPPCSLEPWTSLAGSTRQQLADLARQQTIG